MSKISQNRYPIYDQNGWKTLRFGAAHTYIAHIREYPPPLSPVISSMHSCSATLSFCLLCSPSHSSVRILFRLCHFARSASGKTELRKNYLSAWSVLRNTRVFLRFARKFHHKSSGSKLSKRWLAQLSENPVKGVCRRSL